MDNNEFNNEQLLNNTPNNILNEQNDNQKEVSVPNTNEVVNQTNTMNNTVIPNMNNIQNNYEPTGIGINITDNNTDMNSNLNNNINVEHKKSKLPFIIIVIVFILLVIAGVLYFLINKTFTATNYINETIKLTNKFIDDTIPDVTAEQINLNEDDIKNTGSISFTSNDPSLAIFNNINLKYDIAASLKNDYANIAYTLAQKEVNLTGELAAQKDTIYLEFKNIIDKVIKYNTGANLFTDVKNSLIGNNNINPNDIKILSKNLVKYFGEALKNSKTKTSIKGINIEYSYIIDNDNKTKVSNIFNNLIKNDEIYKKLVSVSKNTTTDIPDDFSIDNLKYVVTMNMLNKEIMGAKLTIKDKVYNLDRVEKNKYKFYNNNNKNNYVSIDTSKGLDVKTYLENNLNYSLSIINSGNKSTININSLLDNFLISLENTKIDNKNNNMNINVSINDYKITASLKNTTGTNSITVDGTIKVNYKNYETNIDINNTLKYDKSLVTTKNFTNTIDYNTLTEQEQQDYIIKLLTSLVKFPFLSSYASSIYKSMINPSY